MDILLVDILFCLRWYKFKPLYASMGPNGVHSPRNASRRSTGEGQKKWQSAKWDRRFKSFSLYVCYSPMDELTSVSTLQLFIYIQTLTCGKHKWLWDRLLFHRPDTILVVSVDLGLIYEELFTILYIERCHERESSWILCSALCYGCSCS